MRAPSPRGVPRGTTTSSTVTGAPAAGRAPGPTALPPSTPLPRRTFLRRITAVLGLSALAMAGAAAFAAPAAAHDELIASDPADGTVIDAAPSTVTLEYSAEIQGIGAEVMVVDEDGVDRAEGAPVVDGIAVLQPVTRDAPAGMYTVLWRVVSSDGHPIDGAFTFTVSGGSAPSPDATASPGSTASPGTTASPDTTAPEPAAPETPEAEPITVTATPIDAPDLVAEEDGGVWDNALVRLAVGLAVLGAIAAVIIRIRRRR